MGRPSGFFALGSRKSAWEPAHAQAQDPKQGRTEAIPMQALDARKLRSLALTLLGRPPFDSERELWLGRGVLEWYDAIAPSAEAWRHWYEEQLYYFLLIDNFRPESENAREIPVALAEGRMHVREALHRLALSPSFDLRNPGADTFVTVVMEQFLGANVQKSARELEQGKTIYDGRRATFLGSSGETQADVVRIVVQSREAAAHFLAREYTRLFGEEAAPKDMHGSARRLHDEPNCYLALVREWLQSDALARRLARPQPLSNRLFVRALFVDLLGREPEAEEVEPLRNALDSLADARPLRSVLVRLLLDSRKLDVPEKASIENPTAWISSLFQRLLGRAGTEEELKIYTQTFHEPECRPATILLALLSHPEYHRY